MSFPSRRAEATTLREKQTLTENPCWNDLARPIWETNDPRTNQVVLSVIEANENHHHLPACCIWWHRVDKLQCGSDHKQGFHREHIWNSTRNHEAHGQHNENPIWLLSRVSVVQPWLINGTSKRSRTVNVQRCTFWLERNQRKQSKKNFFCTS